MMYTLNSLLLHNVRSRQGWEFISHVALGCRQTVLYLKYGWLLCNM